MSEIQRAVAALRAGGLVAFPTETVYGLGADAANRGRAARACTPSRAVRFRHPVIVHLARASQLDDVATDISDAARTLAHEFWPGPLTLVVRKRPVIADAATGGLDTVGLRVPDHPVALALLDAFGGGVAAPSANRFGQVSPTTAAARTR